MLTIRPVSDLRNHFPEVERIALETGQPVFLTKNGYGSMVLMSLEHYGQLTRSVDAQLDEADAVASNNPQRLGHQEVFAQARERAGKAKQNGDA